MPSIIKLFETCSGKVLKEQINEKQTGLCCLARDLVRRKWKNKHARALQVFTHLQECIKRGCPPDPITADITVQNTPGLLQTALQHADTRISQTEP